MSQIQQIRWQTFPRSTPPQRLITDLARIFESVGQTIDSRANQLPSDSVLALLRPGLIEAGFAVESGKQASQKVSRPVLFGENGKTLKSFDADAFHPEGRLVLEVEAGRAVTNYQFLKDLFQACMMQDTDHLAIAVRNFYRDSTDYEKVVAFFDTLYSSDRLELPLKSVTVFGY